MLKMRKKPFSVSLSPTKAVKTIVGRLEGQGLTPSWDLDAGTVEVRDSGSQGNDVVFRAIQKGDKRQPWICSFYDGGRFVWIKNESEQKGA